MSLINSQEAYLFPDLPHLSDPVLNYGKRRPLLNRSHNLNTILSSSISNQIQAHPLKGFPRPKIKPTPQAVRTFLSQRFQRVGTGDWLRPGEAVPMNWRSLKATTTSACRCKTVGEKRRDDWKTSHPVSPPDAHNASRQSQSQGAKVKPQAQSQAHAA